MKPLDVRAPRRRPSGRRRSRPPAAPAGSWTPGAQRQRDGILAAAAEQRARRAVVRDLLRHPDVRHDREAQPHEVRRLVGERAERREPARGAASTRARSRAAGRSGCRADVLVDDQRAHFGDVAAQRRQLGAADRPRRRCSATMKRGACATIVVDACAAAGGRPRGCPRSAGGCRRRPPAVACLKSPIVMRCVLRMPHAARRPAVRSPRRSRRP